MRSLNYLQSLMGLKYWNIKCQFNYEIMRNYLNLGIYTMIINLIPHGGDHKEDWNGDSQGNCHIRRTLEHTLVAQIVS